MIIIITINNVVMLLKKQEEKPSSKNFFFVDVDVYCFNVFITTFTSRKICVSDPLFIRDARI